MGHNLASIELPSGMSLQRGHANAGECLPRRSKSAADLLALPIVGAQQVARLLRSLRFVALQRCCRSLNR